MDRNIPINEFPNLDIFTDDKNFKVSLNHSDDGNGIYIFQFSIQSEDYCQPEPITLRWRLPSFNIKGVWKAGGIHDKRQQYDWELEHPTSRISVDAPIITVFSHTDTNIHTIACSDAINLIEMNALLREEDNSEYCHITFFKESHPAVKHYSADIRIDTREVPFSKSIQDVSKWWETYPNLQPHPTPDIARAPLYSSWYQFHQVLNPDILLSECGIAHKLGYELIILDDGWQTLDNNRGYDYTGDWEPIRFPDMAAFVEKIHETGMKFGLWFSVPFCGQKSKAYQKFKGKFLTENHRWAPVFDPRYPEVRNHLISIYVNALKAWNLDAFKFDFIDDFKTYPETVLTKEDGRDYANVNEAVDRLLLDALTALRAIKPHIAIEFRQQYIGPALRKYGNMFRAFDCPNDVVSNRIRVTDVKLLCGNTAVHSDPQTWHREEKVELAALQILNGFFGVPQMSMLLDDLPEDHFDMVKFYTHYWNENKRILLDGQFVAHGPLVNYPCLVSSLGSHCIIGLYEDFVIRATLHNSLDIINAKMTETVALKNDDKVNCSYIKYNCIGQLVEEGSITLTKGIVEILVPKSGLIRLSRI